MKLAIYLTKTKVVYAGKSLDWTGGDLTKVFKELRRDERVRDVRIVLGDDVSFVASFKAGDNLSKEKIEEAARGQLPFPLISECFDYRIMTGVGGEQWVQIAAVEKSLLDAVSSGVLASGLAVELMIPIGVLLGERTSGKETPAMVKWNGVEVLTVLAVNGITEAVFTDETDEQINIYAKNKWNLDVDLERIAANDTFDLTKEAFKEKARGSDAEVLSIPILQKQAITVEEVKPVEGGVVTPVVKKPGVSMLTKILLIVLALALLVMGVVMYLNSQTPKEVPVLTPAVVVEVSPSVTPTETPVVEEEVDLSGYVVQVLNGSGITGEAGRIRDLLLANGFVTVDVGNAPDRTDTLVQRKADFEDAALTSATDNIKDYKAGDIGLLTSDNKYDLVIVLGSDRSL